ncbi:MAG: radical SAM protein [Patescibacteria group bacterium]
MKSIGSIIRPDIPGIFNEIFILKKHLIRFKYALNKKAILPPYEVLIHPISRCNLQCKWCIGANVPNAKARTKLEMQQLPSTLSDSRNMEKVVKNVLSYKKKVGNKIYKVENVSFSGIVGEPLMAKDAFIKAVEILSKNNIRIGLFSNATLLNDELIETLLKVAYVNISIDSGCSKTYAKLKYGGLSGGGAIFNNLLANIKKLVDKRNETNSKLEINISYILYPKNYKEIYQLAKRMKEMGIDNLRMKQDNSGKHLLSKEQMKEANKLLKKIDKIKNKNFNFIKIHKLNNPSEMRRCEGSCIITDLFAAVGSDGNMYPCNYHPRKGGYVYGNLLTNSFKSIWEGKKRKDIKAKLPLICPAVCDPFKNRSNRLFNFIKQYQQEKGRQKTNQLITKLRRIV